MFSRLIYSHLFLLSFLYSYGSLESTDTSDAESHDLVQRVARQAGPGPYNGPPMGPPPGPPFGPPFPPPYRRRPSRNDDDDETDDDEITFKTRRKSSTERKILRNPDRLGTRPSGTLRRAARVRNLREGLATHYDSPAGRFNSSLSNRRGVSRLTLDEMDERMGRIPETDSLSSLDAPRSGFPDVNVLAIQERDPVPIKRINPAELEGSLTEAMEFGRQDFQQILMRHRPPECILGEWGPGKPHPLLWMVAKPISAARYGYVNEFTAIRLATGYTKGNGEQLYATLDALGGENGIFGDDQCFVEEIRCNKRTPYRTFDGTCNNLQHTDWGAAKTGHVRMTYAAYEDGVSSPREISVMSLINREITKLPPAREVSLTLSRGQSRPDKKTTMLTMQFGQFIAHDVVRTAADLVQDPNKPSEWILPGCCGVDPHCRHPACDPIDIPPNDPFYGPHGIRCMEFIRYQPANPRTCNLSPRTPSNLNSAYLDVSATYGSSPATALRLRGPRGSLNVNDSPLLKPGYIMPMPGEDSMSCHAPDKDRRCLFTGDSRGNQHTGVVSMVSLFIREHNRIVRYLARNRPELPDEVLYQGARRIVIAEYQNIIYNEYLPVILGKTIYKDVRNGLTLKRKGYCTDCYDTDVNPGISTEFAQASFRTLHSTIPDWLPARNESGSFTQFWEHMLNPNMFYRQKPEYGIVDEILTNFVKLPSESYDSIYSFNMQNLLFKMANVHWGQDLLSFDIQRERDVGNPSYLDLRAACGLPIVTTFADLEDWMSPRAVANLAKIYHHVLDIDGVAGMASEYGANGGEAVVGPTAACLIVDQFRRLKQGDRFWYENKEAKFTSEQLDELRRSSIAAILCGSTTIAEIQPRAFLHDSPRNPVTPCPVITSSALQLEPFLFDLNIDKFPNMPAEVPLMPPGPPPGPPGPGGPAPPVAVM